MRFFDTILILSLYCVGALTRTIRVHEGESIQAAIDTASQGDKIVVGAGTYAEQLTIKLRGIQLVGQGAKLTPPSSFVKNTCTNECGQGTEAGICVQGAGIRRAAYYSEHRKVLAVESAVKSVSIKGFNVSGFSGANIMVLGGQDTDIVNNTLVDGPTYGFLTAGSINTHMEGNIVTSSTPEGSGFIAMCMDDFEGVVASGNAITNYAIGLCIETKGAVVQQNTVSSTCNAIFLDPFVQEPRILDNHISTSFTVCGGFGSYGIVLDGSNGAVIQNNLIENQSNDGPAAGAAVFDDPCSAKSPSCAKVNQTAVALGNTITHNIFRSNDLDLYINTTGTHNRFKPNRCSSSSPTGLCKGM